MEQPDLFLTEDRRLLRALGWQNAGCVLGGVPAWKRPDDGAIVEESEALEWLYRWRRANQGRGQ